MMHPEQGFQSQLFKSIHTYLCNPDRVQPIIGLRSIIELCTDTKPPMYLCEVCALRANMTDIKTHITGSLHRYSYIKSCQTYELGANTDLAPQAWHLLDLAKHIEKNEGTGNVQVLQLHEDIYKEMISQPVLDVLAHVKQIQQTQTNVTEFQLPFCRTATKETHFNDDYSNYYGDLDQATPSCTTPPSLMSYSTVSNKMSNETQNQFKTQNQVQFWFPAQFFCPDRDTSAQGSVISPVQASTQSLPAYNLPNSFPNLNTTAPFSSIPATGAFQTCNPINDSMQNVTVHEEKSAHSWENVFNAFECISTESPSSHTVQTTKPNYMRVAHCENDSLTVTITQKRNPEQESKQDHLTTLKMRSAGAHTPAITWNEDHFQNNDYLTSEELYRDTDWVLNNRNGVGQEDGQHPQPFTADDALFTYERMDQCQQLNDYSEENILLLPKHNEDSPENYSGTQPLIGLNAVIKCQSLAGDPPSCCYLCQPCSIKVLQSDIIQHLISPLHQINYINFQYPHLSNCHSGLQNLEAIAMQLEQEEGRGQMEVRRLSACLFNEVLEQDFYCSMKVLNPGKETEKTRLNQKAVRKMSRITSDYNMPLKRIAGLSDCDESATIGKPPLCHKRAKKKARLSEPVFKVSLLLNEGHMLVDRIPLVKETVAPEIE